jgi:hypothetical protein
MLEARQSLEPADVVAIDEIYLEWLRAAQVLDGGACREVTGRSFYDGVPEVDDQVLDRERQITRRLVESGKLDRIEPGLDDAEAPEWLLGAVAERTDLDQGELAEILSSEVDPRRCAVTIAFLEAALLRPEDVPLELLAGL